MFHKNVFLILSYLLFPLAGYSRINIVYLILLSLLFQYFSQFYACESFPRWRNPRFAGGRFCVLFSTPNGKSIRQVTSAFLWAADPCPPPLIKQGLLNSECGVTAISAFPSWWRRGARGGGYFSPSACRRQRDAVINAFRFINEH